MIKCHGVLLCDTFGKVEHNYLQYVMLGLDIFFEPIRTFLICSWINSKLKLIVLIVNY